MEPVAGPYLRADLWLLQGTWVKKKTKHLQIIDHLEVVQVEAL